MIFLWILLALSVGMMLGWIVCGRLRTASYHGVMRVTETPNGLQYSLELAGDPELLAFQDLVVFKVLPPDYEELMSRGKLGV